jgi:hypothetical protein
MNNHHNRSLMLSFTQVIDDTIQYRL